MTVSETINRERWRRYARGEMTKKELSLLVADLADEIAEEIVARRAYQINVLFRGAMCLVLHDKRGHGKKRLLEDLEYVEKTLEAYADGLLSIDDMVETVKAETGVDVTVDKS